MDAPEWLPSLLDLELLGPSFGGNSLIRMQGFEERMMKRHTCCNGIVLRSHGIYIEKGWGTWILGKAKNLAFLRASKRLVLDIASTILGHMGPLENCALFGRGCSIKKVIGTGRAYCKCQWSQDQGGVPVRQCHSVTVPTGAS